jgi:aromatic ring-opening dioxygenase catalytic subunit (LigB family)
MDMMMYYCLKFANWIRQSVVDNEEQEKQCSINININHGCSGTATNITYSECMFVALGVRHSVRMRHIAIRGLPGSAVFFHII